MSLVSLGRRLSEASSLSLSAGIASSGRSEDSERKGKLYWKSHDTQKSRGQDERNKIETWHSDAIQ